MIYANRLNEKVVNNQGVIVEIIEYCSATNCTVKFEDNTILYNREYKDIKRGTTRNPNLPIMYGIGYLGVGIYNSRIDNKFSKIYGVWHDMIRRCYDPKSEVSHPTYKNCFVTNEWHNFQNFAKWFEENYVESYQLDKDILIKGNKIYGPNTCCFVPKEINNLFLKNNKKRNSICIGVFKNKCKYIAQLNIENKNSKLGSFDTIVDAFVSYKQNKEIRIKQKAEKYRNRIANNVYVALVMYQVEISD